MITTLWGRLGVLFLAFSLLVSISVAAISWTKASQQEDALVIQLAGTQPMLVQQMATQAQESAEQFDEHRHSAAMQEAARAFEQILSALTNGGKVAGPSSLYPSEPDLSSAMRPGGSDHWIDVPATQDPNILAQLNQVQHTWDPFRGHLDVIVATAPGNPDFGTAVQAVARLSPRLVQEVQELVRLYETAAVDKAARLRWVQGAIVASALVLLAVGFLVTQKSVMTSLRTLGSVAERIRRGDLNTPVELTGPSEIEAVAHCLDMLRIQLQTSQAELVARAERLDSRGAQRTQGFTPALEISLEVVAELDLSQLLSSVTDRARLMTRAQAAALCLLDPNGEYLHLAARSGETAVQAGSRQTVGRGLAAQVVGAGETVSVEASCVDCAFLNAHGPGQCVAAPLGTGEQTFGALCVVRSELEGFGPDETRALPFLASSAAIAIANASLVESGRRLAERAAALAEREHLAANLHDHLAQTLGFLNLKASGLQELLAAGRSIEAGSELDRVQTVLNKAYGQVRAALVGLRQAEGVADDPSNGSEQGLAGELAACLTEFRETSGFSADLAIADPAALALPPLAQRQALNIVREALTNARRHAQMQRVWVRVERVAERGEARFTVQDDGRGFDPAKNGSDNHLGLTIMRARAERCGGRLVIDSAPGAGTKVVATFPLNERETESSQ